MMNIEVRPYTRRDGSVMFYIRNDRGVSIGISKERGYQSSKATAGEKKLWNAFCAAARRAAEPGNEGLLATGFDRSKHTEAGFDMHNGIGFAMTDIATVGSVSVQVDGLYVVVGDKIVGRKFTYISEDEAAQ